MIVKSDGHGELERSHRVFSAFGVFMRFELVQDVLKFASEVAHTATDNFQKEGKSKGGRTGKKGRQANQGC